VPSQGVPKDDNFREQITATKTAIYLNMTVYVPGQGFFKE